VRGDRLAILLPNSLAGIELFAGAVLSGHVVVPLNFRWSIDELADALADSGAKALVVDDRFRDAGVAAAAREQTILIDCGDSPAEGSIIYESLFDRVSSPINDCAESDLLAIFYTGGTTGRSKGVMLSHGNVAYVAMAGMAEGVYSTDEIYLHTSPSFHIATVRCGCCACRDRGGGRHPVVVGADDDRHDSRSSQVPRHRHFECAPHPLWCRSHDRVASGQSDGGVSTGRIYPTLWHDRDGIERLYSPLTRIYAP
jgi:hypothetical protein